MALTERYKQLYFCSNKLSLGMHMTAKGLKKKKACDCNLRTLQTLYSILNNLPSNDKRWK